MARKKAPKRRAWRDPIIEEVRRVRDAISRRYGNDIDRIAEALRISLANREAAADKRKPSRG